MRAPNNKTPVEQMPTLFEFQCKEEPPQQAIHQKRKQRSISSKAKKDRIFFWPGATPCPPTKRIADMQKVSENQTKEIFPFLLQLAESEKNRSEKKQLNETSKISHKSNPRVPLTSSEKKPNRYRRELKKCMFINKEANGTDVSRWAKTLDSARRARTIDSL